MALLHARHRSFDFTSKFLWETEIMKRFHLLAAAAAGAMAIAAPATAANLLINGDFEASSNPTTTPPGWTNIGHSDGVIAYSAFNTPAYDGLYYYDIGGFGSPLPALGDGIEQTVATIAGEAYTLTFGYSGENTFGSTTILDVTIGSVLTQFTIIADGSGVFQMPFTTTSINYVAAGGSTTIKFQVSSSTNLGSHDPLLDKIIFEGAGAGVVPEPATWAMMIMGFGLVGTVMRRRKTAVSFA
jgi:hypothetical protein